MTDAEKAYKVLEKIHELTCADKVVTLSSDWGAGTMTIDVDGAHTHVGLSGDDNPLEVVIDGLYMTLCEGTGLSWA